MLIVGESVSVAFVGELAALGTALCWSFSSIFFTIGTRRLGPSHVNRLRLLFAVVLVGGAHWLLFGKPFPWDASPDRFFWLALSAVIGLVLGDSLLFRSYMLVGTRLGMLMMSLSPIFGALLAWPLLGETLSPLEILAMCVALSGVGWVVFERAAKGDAVVGPHRFVRGILFGLGAGICQAVTLIVAKRGLYGEFSAVSGVMVRMTAAAVTMWGWALVRGQFRETWLSLKKDPRAGFAVLGGAISGPSIGVWLSLVAVQATRVGIASTLMAMSPVLVLPLVRWVFKERVSTRAVVGTAVAMCGVAMMFLL